MHRQNSLLCLVVAVTFVSASVPRAAAQDLNATFSEMDRAAQIFKSMTSDIKRLTFTAAINDTSYDGGTMKMKRSKKDTKMLIEFTGAEAKTVALEGETLRILYPKTKVVQYWGLGKNRGLVDQFLLLGFGASSQELKSAYTITSPGQERINGQNTTHLVLIPKSADVLKRLKKADLWIWEAKGVPLQQKFTTSSDGDYMQVTYTNLKVNAPISDSDLQLKEPKGFKKEYPQQ